MRIWISGMNGGSNRPTSPMQKKSTSQPVRRSLGEGGSAPARQPARESFRSSFSEGGFFTPRALLALVVCSAAACSMLSGALLAFFHSDAPNASQRTLTFAERVGYQRAIEEVYWRHRIWPEERPDPKPSLDVVMPRAQVEKKVKDYLRNSQALEQYWQRPITAEQLQAEIDRMAKRTKQPDVLRELFQALGNDPFVIAECLARPLLAERLFNSVQAYHDVTWTVSQRSNSRKPDKPWRGHYILPTVATPSNAGGTCIDAWAATNTVNAPIARDLHTAVWTGSEMIVWAELISLTT